MGYRLRYISFSIKYVETSKSIFGFTFILIKRSVLPPQNEKKRNTFMVNDNIYIDSRQTLFFRIIFIWKLSLLLLLDE